jgi:tight adherence protein C
MFQAIFSRLDDPKFIISLLVALATAATIITLAMPLLESDTLGRRIKAASIERDRIRARERERLAQKGAANRGNLRQEPKAFMKQVVESFSLTKWLGTEKAKQQLAMAGFRGQQAEIAFLFFRLVTPILLFILALFYVFVVGAFNYGPMIKLGIAIGAAYAGIKVPEVFLRNTTQKRQQSMRRAFPDALDLLLICVESGMSIEHAFRRVSQEIGAASVPLAEELTLTTAELSFLPDRRVAYENLGNRTGVDSIRQITTVLIQAERYGTPLGTALRVVSQESRDNRMLEAEKKAAALPPKLTVPMIIFFLPVLFAVIMTPAIIQIMAVS